MRIVELHCPRCHATEAERVATDQYRCSHCGGMFVLDRSQGRDREVEAPLPVPRPLATRAGPDGRAAASPKVVIAVAAVVLLAALLGAVSFLAWMRPSPRRLRSPAVSSLFPPRPSSPLPGPRPAPAIALPDEPPRAELREIRSGRSMAGGLFWLVTYANVGKLPIQRPTAVVSLFDASGKRVEEQPGWSPVQHLLPGESAPILVLIFEPPAFARAEVVARSPEAAGAGDGPPRVKVVEQVVRADFGRMKKVVGTVRNEEERSVRFVRVVVVGRDADGKMASMANGDTGCREIGPGQSCGFAVHTGTFEVTPPVRYEVFATAH